MQKIWLSLFFIFSIHTGSHADHWESIKGPTVLEGVVLMSGFDEASINNSGYVEHLSLLVIKNIILGKPARIILWPLVMMAREKKI